MEDLIEALKPWLNYSRDVMMKNLELLVKKYENVIEECYKLINDVTDVEARISPREVISKEKRMEIYSKYLMYPMIFHVVYPNLNFLPILILLGAVPQAYYTLRTALEALVIALYADDKEDLRDMFWYEKIEHESEREHLRYQGRST